MNLPDSLEKPLLILLQGKDLLPAFFVQVKKEDWGLGLQQSVCLSPYLTPLY